MPIFHTATDIAIFFGLSYKDLAKIIYTNHHYQYKSFLLKKKSGGTRVINAPSKQLKEIQYKLKDYLDSMYSAKPSTHGFVSDRSIMTNAKSHLDKTFIFNIDLENFFGSIHFGRIRNLFRCEPFNFNNTVSIILAQICCFNGILPQGAPTSPTISNMIARKLDSQLQTLARDSHARYTRYADDISFSFNYSRSKLPSNIVNLSQDGSPTVGDELNRIIKHNGFTVNQQKTRLNSRNSRMEVTGITVNEFPNVPRRYVKNISSMIHAWDKYGYQNAQAEYTAKYNIKQRLNDKQTSFKEVVRGKLLYLKQVRGERDPIYTKLARKYNGFVDVERPLAIIEITLPESNAVQALWVIESENNTLPECQGTGFELKGVGIVTSAHVIGDLKKKEVFSKILSYKDGNASQQFELKVERVCWHRDLAICTIQNPPSKTFYPSVDLSTAPAQQSNSVIIMGFPSYAPGHGHSIYESSISKTFTKSTVNVFEVNITLQEGNSGGPAFNEAYEVVGIVATHAHANGGMNLCIDANEITIMQNDIQFLVP